MHANAFILVQLNGHVDEKKEQRAFVDAVFAGEFSWAMERRIKFFIRTVNFISGFI